LLQTRPLVTPEAAAKLELLFYKLASAFPVALLLIKMIFFGGKKSISV
jgi:hypothetical protein